MSDFFDVPPRSVAEEARFRMPPWLGPPRGTLPGVVPSEMVLASTARVAVCLSRLSVYPTGFEIDLLVLAADDRGPEMHDAFHRMHRRGESEEVPPELLRLGFQFADGSKTTNLSGFHAGDGPPGGPVMVPRGGGGGGDSWRQTVWVWPLPPPGPLSIVLEWPAFDIPITREDVDAQEVLDAAARAQVLFSDENLAEWQPDMERGGPPSAVRRLRAASMKFRPGRDCPSSSEAATPTARRLRRPLGVGRSVETETPCRL